MGSYWWALLFGIILAYLLFHVVVSTENGRYRFDIFKLKIPVVGTLIRKVLVLRFVSMLGILIEAGLPVVQALSIVAISLNNEIYRLKVYQVISRVQQGEKISASLMDTPFLFSETIVQMLAVGEQSASIGLISSKIAKQYDIEIDNALKRVTSLFEPIMIVFVGFSVALLALAILTPIFRLSQLV
jgi:type II secretory pathway component PulF